jgi:hypothetical protein
VRIYYRRRCNGYSEIMIMVSHPQNSLIRINQPPFSVTRWKELEWVPYAFSLVKNSTTTKATEKISTDFNS